MSLLAVESVSRRFGSLVAVKDVSLRVEAGELRAIIGPNGAGKTTFFNMISGFLLPTSGRILFEDRDITAVAPHVLVAAVASGELEVSEAPRHVVHREQAHEVAALARAVPTTPRGKKRTTSTNTSPTSDIQFCVWLERKSCRRT